MDVSFIVPAYNVEKYIDKCIASLLAQTTVAKEIIIINDGSADGTLLACNKFLNHPEITIISTENKGLSEARNFGFSFARGRYVMFVDSDDWLEPNSVKTLIQQADQKCLDFITFNYRIEYQDSGFSESSGRSLNSRVLSGRQLFSELINRNEYQPMAWLVLARTAFLQGIEGKLFFPGIFFEDMAFSLDLYSRAQRACSVSLIVYNYLKRRGSITESNCTKKHRDRIFVGNLMFEYYKKQIEKDNVVEKYIMDYYVYILKDAIKDVKIWNIVKHTSDRWHMNLNILRLSCKSSIPLRRKLKCVIGSLAPNIL